MKNLAYLLLLGILNMSDAQEHKTIYLFFDSDSSQLCELSESQQGRYHGTKQIKRYQKAKQKNGDIDFYICKELFSFKIKNKIDTCNTIFLKKVNFSDLEKLKKRVKKENPLYPSKVFSDVIIIEKLNDSIILKYNVEWKYYVE